MQTRSVAVNRERKGTVEAAVRRALVRASEVTVQRPLEMFDIITLEPVREHGRCAQPLRGEFTVYV